jgi:hypothetical protein
MPDTQVGALPHDILGHQWVCHYEYRVGPLRHGLQVRVAWIAIEFPDAGVHRVHRIPGAFELPLVCVAAGLAPVRNPDHCDLPLSEESFNECIYRGHYDPFTIHQEWIQHPMSVDSGMIR